MKFLVVLCLLAVAAADEDKNQDKKTQSVDTTQTGTIGLTSSTGSLLNSQVFPTFPSLAYTGFNGNLSPIQGVNPDFFSTATTGTPVVVNGVIPNFRSVIPNTPVNPIQTGYSGVFPNVPVVGSQFPITTGILSSVAGVPGVTGGAIDPNTAANGAISTVPSTAYRFLAPESLAGIQTQAYQTAQSVIPAFTGSVLPQFTSGVLQGQNIPTNVLKNPTGTTSGISNVPSFQTGNVSSGPLTSVFRQA